MPPLSAARHLREVLDLAEQTSAHLLTLLGDLESIGVDAVDVTTGSLTYGAARVSVRPDTWRRVLNHLGGDESITWVSGTVCAVTRSKLVRRDRSVLFVECRVAMEDVPRELWRHLAVQADANPAPELPDEVAA